MHENLPGQAAIESLLYLSFQRQKYEEKFIIALIKSCLNIVIIHYIFSNFS